jgi:hypothetical protein
VGIVAAVAGGVAGLGVGGGVEERLLVVTLGAELFFGHQEQGGLLAFVGGVAFQAFALGDGGMRKGPGGGKRTVAGEAESGDRCAQLFRDL